MKALWPVQNVLWKWNEDNCWLWSSMPMVWDFFTLTVIKHWNIVDHTVDARSILVLSCLVRRRFDNGRFKEEIWHLLQVRKLVYIKQMLKLSICYHIVAGTQAGCSNWPLCGCHGKLDPLVWILRLTTPMGCCGHCTIKASWPNGEGAWLRIRRFQVRVLAGSNFIFGVVSMI